MINLIILYFSLVSLIIAQPTIDLIEPAFGGIGNTITISGENFSSNSQANTLFFGGLEANILNSTENALMVSVPYGTYYAPISVYTNGLYATSSKRFNVTFNAAEELAVAHLSIQLIDQNYYGARYDIKIADMNGDGVPEIVTSKLGDGSLAFITIYETSFDDDGMISIEEAIALDFETGVYSEPQDIALGDLNGDGLLDVVASEKEHDHTCVFINTSQNQSFSFNAPITISANTNEGFAQVQDINGDGKLDIVTTGFGAPMRVYLNTTESNNVSFAYQVLVEDFVASRPAFADLNGDGMIDMVTSAFTNNFRDVYIYSNNSTVENIDFNLEFVIQSGGEDPVGTDWIWDATSPKLADIDGDEKLDIVVLNGSTFQSAHSGISILRNTSTDVGLSFEYDYSSFYYYESNSLPMRSGISDLNGDGKPDILTADWMGGVSIVVNSSTEGNISLEEQMIIGVGGFPRSPVMSDLNMDCTPEIVVGNWEVEGMRVIHNFLPVDEQINDLLYDINNDGVVNNSDFVMLLSFVIGENDSVSAVDINFDSVVDIFDLLLLSDFLQNM